jgi:exo-1,4-beta-D-glucosaminidase
LKYRFNAGWPSLGYQYYDYYLRPNGAFYGAQKACEPIHVQYSYDDRSIYVINSYYKSSGDLRVSAQIRNFDMAVKYSNKTSTEVGPDASQYVFTIPDLEGLTDTYFLSLRLENTLGELLSSNFYWLSVADDKSADFRNLGGLPTVDVRVSGNFTNRGEDSVVNLKLENPSSSLAFFVHVSLIKGLHGSEVLPVYWSTNYVSLLPGERTEIRGNVDHELLGGQSPHVMISGWNVGPKELVLDGSDREVTPKIDYLDFKAPAKVGVGRRFEVSVTVKNAAEAGACLVKGRHHLYIDGKPSDFRRTALAPGESKRLMWPYTRIFEPGEHQVTIGQHPPATVIVEP